MKTFDFAIVLEDYTELSGEFLWTLRANGELAKDIYGDDLVKFDELYIYTEESDPRKRGGADCVYDFLDSRENTVTLSSLMRFVFVELADNTAREKAR